MRGTLSLLGFLLLCATMPAVADEREYIYGAELMTPAERDAYRRGLRQAPSEAARDDYRQRHRKQLQQRAQQRGKHLDDKGIVRGGEGER